MKSYIICLSNIESSLLSAQRLQSQLEQFDMQSELFEGSYGDITKKQYESIGRKCHPWGFKGPELPYPEDYKIELSTPGVIGCFDSHYRLWKLCADLDEPIIVFEDDADIVRPFISVNWDEVLSLVFSHNKKMQKYIDYLENPTGIPAASNYKQSSMPGNAGYAIKPVAARKLVDCYENTFLPADNAINQHVVKIQIHNYMMGKAVPRVPTAGKSSLIRTNFWENRN